MSKIWLQDYILLAFRIDKAMQNAQTGQFVEAYYGPSSWKEQVETEAETPAADLVRRAIKLEDTLAIQGFTAQRATYLNKHMRAMEMMARQLAGETFSLEEEARACLDIAPMWTVETQFEQAHTLYETVLPGTGDLAERLRAYRAEIAYPQEQLDALPCYIDMAFAEARRRTSSLIELPKDENIDIEYLSEWEHDAAAYYEGHYRTRIVMNVAATAKFFSRLFDHKVCHEGYPGHHSEYILKEQRLYRQRGYEEQAICLTLCPQCVMQEGIAMMAHEMIFSEGEAEQWLVKQVYQPLQKEVDAQVLLRLRQASQMLEGVWHNAAMLLDEGWPEQEVEQYFARYMLLTEDKAKQMVALLKHPIWGRNALAYMSGQKLMQPWLQTADRVAVFCRFLTEQFVPSQLTENELPMQA